MASLVEEYTSTTTAANKMQHMCSCNYVIGMAVLCIFYGCSSLNGSIIGICLIFVVVEIPKYAFKFASNA